MAGHPRADGDAEPLRRAGLASTLRWVALVSSVGALLGALLGFQVGSTFLIAVYFMTVADGPVLLVIAVTCIAFARSADTEAAPAIENALRHSLTRVASPRFACIVGLVVGGSVLMLRHFAYLDFALSVDEFMADFDATIIASGRLLASVAPEWREFVPALQPIFRLPVPGNEYLLSSYLPGNAALRAAFLGIGYPGIEGAVLAPVSIVALYGVARRLWPDRPDAAVVGTVLLASSSQFLITAGTPYAMTAHLALNLTWLWLFLRDTRGSHVLAAGAAFVGCGLHQVVFHPLFAAPFVVSLVLKKRWRAAAFYSTVYAASILFWILYWNLLLRGADASAASSASIGLIGFYRRATELIDPGVSGLVLMLLNLFRFLAWQSPMVVPLALLGVKLQGDRNATLRSLQAGIIITIATAFVVLPFQGHGWGYRYLHGLLGSLSLLAAHGWIIATTNVPGGVTRPALALASSTAVSLLVVLPWQAFEVHDFVTPYAVASRVIESTDARVVVVDDVDIWYGTDLVRNDPLLRNSPKVVSLRALDEAKLRELCARGGVAVFDRVDAARVGIRVVPELPESVATRRAYLREVMETLGCGRRTR